MSSSKFGKNAKQFGSAMKGMAGASVNAWAMEQLMKLIEPFMKLLKLLEIPINVLAALLTMMVNEIFVDLLPYFILFSQELLKLAPSFKLVGEFLSFLIISGFTLLYIAFQKTYEFLKPLVLLIKEETLFKLV